MSLFQRIKPSAFLLLALLGACKTPSVKMPSEAPKSYSTTTFPQTQRPKNIIFMVGDGMGLSLQNSF